MSKRAVKVFTAAVWALFVLAAVPHPVFPGTGVAWETDWSKALTGAAAASRPVLADFYTDWCPHCKKLDAVTFIDNSVIDYFNKENWVLVKINPEKDRTAEEKFKVYSYPTLIIFNAKGAEIDRILGFQAPADLIGALENLKKGIGTLEDLLGRQAKTKGQKTKENFELMSKIMEKYIARADYPAALEVVAQVVELDKDNAQKQASSALYQKGYIYYKWKKYKEAIDALLYIHQVYPGSEDAVEGYAAAAYYAGKIKDPGLALKIYREFLKTYPNSQYAEESKEKIAELEKTIDNK
jgi:thiol-disulfide isomerase/thioredoxin